MCGKFTMMMTWEEYCLLAGIGTGGGHGFRPPIDPQTVLQTFTPMRSIPILHLGPVRQRRSTLMRWGWHVPNDPKKHYWHARSEEIDTKPTWHGPFRETRGVIWTKQFNIGEELPNGKTKKWVCNRPDMKPVALAVIYSEWELLEGPLRAFVMVTTQSCAPLNERDDRMPAILADEDEVAMWLGETGEGEDELKKLLQPYDGKLTIRPQEGAPNAKKDAPPRAKKRKSDPQPGLF
jgi:putative SOS response-associated peptidase YedK